MVEEWEEGELATVDCREADCGVLRHVGDLIAPAENHNSAAFKCIRVTTGQLSKES